ncbi:hypothetical protein GPUN_0210 [Glaciecola punicea ACAM 611]|uniref:Uncharacterized protein n=1 Tax=Glaciecola punicea ACAM 611 TaxID=1121923 RepID=H5T7T7_9ALTE|nr:hypothetical protein GPUN_0210 [Glaciecola punicea ACAM 611]
MNNAEMTIQMRNYTKVIMVGFSSSSISTIVPSEMNMILTMAYK